MTKRIFFGGTVICATALLAATAMSGRIEHAEFSNGANGEGARVPVLVELFTSEGCSSCPPADTLLAKMEKEQPIANAEVIALEEHVDYWNSGGWFDPFSSTEMTSRQNLYAEMLAKGNVYTPEMVVDGRTEFVGSREGEARQAIQEAAAMAGTGVKVVQNKGDGGNAIFKVEVGKLAGGSGGDTAEVWLAITEAGLHTAVKAGENAGQEWQHAPVVRTLRKIGVASGTGETSFRADQKVKIDGKWKIENLHAVIFVQGKKSHQILGAAEVSVQH